MADLKTYDRKRPCPKCRFIRATTEYHDGYHGGCPIEGSSNIEVYWAMRGGLGWAVSQETKDKIAAIDRQQTDAQKAIPEHFDRECPNCKHRWAEAVA